MYFNFFFKKSLQKISIVKKLLLILQFEIN